MIRGLDIGGLQRPPANRARSRERSSAPEFDKSGAILARKADNSAIGCSGNVPSARGGRAALRLHEVQHCDSLHASNGCWCRMFCIDGSRFGAHDRSVSGDRIQNIQRAVEKAAGCPVRYVESLLVVEWFREHTVFEGVVEVFDLEGHPKAKRAYGWLKWGGENARYTAALEIPPVDSANAAVRAAIAAEARNAVSVRVRQIP